MNANYEARAEFAPPEVLSTAAYYVSNEWGHTGYSMALASKHGAVYVFEVAHFDGSRFNIAVDKWGNRAHLDDDVMVAAGQISDMHRNAVTA